MKVLPIARLTLVAGLMAAATWASSVSAQQNAMTLDELEAYVQQQRIELEEAIANRDENRARVEELQIALQEQSERRELLQSEVESLCQEHDDVEPGTFSECMDQYGS